MKAGTLCHALSGLDSVLLHTQGVALGWYVTPLRGLSQPKIIVNPRASDIVQKWIDFFVLNKVIQVARDSVDYATLVHPTAWESGGWDGEPPWMGEVRGFADAVQGLDPEQRAALIVALGEQAPPVWPSAGTRRKGTR